MMGLCSPGEAELESALNVPGALTKNLENIKVQGFINILFYCGKNNQAEKNTIGGEFGLMRMKYGERWNSEILFDAAEGKGGLCPFCP